MRGAVLYGPRDVRFEERDTPRIIKSTDAIIRISATCVCGSDLWPYRGISPVTQPTPMGHEYCGIVEEAMPSPRSSPDSSSSVHFSPPITARPSRLSDFLSTQGVHQHLGAMDVEVTAHTGSCQPRKTG